MSQLSQSPHGRDAGMQLRSAGHFPQRRPSCVPTTFASDVACGSHDRAGGVSKRATQKRIDLGAIGKAPKHLGSCSANISIPIVGESTQDCECSVGVDTSDRIESGPPRRRRSTCKLRQLGERSSVGHGGAIYAFRPFALVHDPYSRPARILPRMIANIRARATPVFPRSPPRFWAFPRAFTSHPSRRAGQRAKSRGSGGPARLARAIQTHVA